MPQASGAKRELYMSPRTLRDSHSRRTDFNMTPKRSPSQTILSVAATQALTIQLIHSTWAFGPGGTVLPSSYAPFLSCFQIHWMTYPPHPRQPIENAKLIQPILTSEYPIELIPKAMAAAPLSALRSVAMIRVVLAPEASRGKQYDAM